MSVKILYIKEGFSPPFFCSISKNVAQFSKCDYLVL